MVHLAVAGHHFEEWWVYGAFFVGVAVAQLGFAVLFVLAPLRPGLAVAGVLGTVAVVAAYVLSRTTGVPIGWHAWIPEPVGALDFGTTVAEVALILCLLPFVASRARSRIVNFLFVCAVLAWGMRLAGILT